jgi:ATP-dependent protease ClpP protease subunit
MDTKPFRTTRAIANLRQGRNDWYRIKAQADGPAQVHIFDEVGYFGVTAKDFTADLADVRGDIELHLSTPGGEVFDGIAIYNTLKQRDGIVRIIVDSLAASIGSVIAMAADPGNLIIAKNASMMIHDGFSMGIGNARDLRELADLLDRTSDNIASIYADRTGKPAAYWREAMLAETWYVGQEAVDAGLADFIQGTEPEDAAPAVRLAASWDLSLFARRPGALAAAASDGPAEVPVDAAARAGQIRNEKYNADDRKRMATDGHAMPDGSYPIADAEDLDNAIRAVGRGGSDHDAIRRHIIARAQALGLSSRIPDNWAGDGSLKESGAAENHIDPALPGAASTPAREDAPAVISHTAWLEFTDEMFVNFRAALEEAQ